MSVYRKKESVAPIEKETLIAIIGPTAVGKTELSLDLARSLGAEIISVDSRQVYRHLDVGTDKISKAIREEIPHHLIDVVDPDQVFSAADFVSLAQAAIRSIHGKKKVTLLVGGTPLFYRALEGNLLTESLPKSDALREELEQEAARLGPIGFHQKLEQVDPASALRLHPNDCFRVTRALEIFYLTGRTATEWYSQGEKEQSPYKITYLGLTRPRDQLYQKIEKRVRQQFASGYYEEVCWLLERYSPKLPALCGFGYKELVAYHEGEMTFEEAIMGDVRATKLFSRRQNTWFKHFSPVTWYDLAEASSKEVLPQLIQKAREALLRFN